MPVASSDPDLPGGPSAPFAYAPLRVVPRIERGECVNVGVVLFCRPRRFLGMRIELDRERLRAFAPELDLPAVERHLEQIRLVCAGDAAGGPIARLSLSERFGWVVAPVSTIVQPGAVHTGLSPDPAAALDHLLRTMVRTRQADQQPG